MPLNGPKLIMWPTILFISNDFLNFAIWDNFSCYADDMGLLETLDWRKDRNLIKVIDDHLKAIFY